MNRYRCINCRDPLTRDLVAIGVRSCGRCAVLLKELGDDVVSPPPESESGSDCRPARIEHKPRRDGRWLEWAATKRGNLRWFHDYGAAHGFDRDIRSWTPGQVERAVGAILAQRAST